MATGSCPACRVEGCTADLSQDKDYCRKHKVCSHHLKELTVLVAGQPSRWCQQCAKFHPITSFDGSRRSCRHRLALHGMRSKGRKLLQAGTAATGSLDLEEQLQPASHPSSTAQPSSSGSSNNMGGKGEQGVSASQPMGDRSQHGDKHQMMGNQSYIQHGDGHQLMGNQSHVQHAGQQPVGDVQGYTEQDGQYLQAAGVMDGHSYTEPHGQYAQAAGVHNMAGVGALGPEAPAMYSDLGHTSGFELPQVGGSILQYQMQGPPVWHQLQADTGKHLLANQSSQGLQQMLAGDGVQQMLLHQSLPGLQQTQADEGLQMLPYGSSQGLHQVQADPGWRQMHTNDGLQQMAPHHSLEVQQQAQTERGVLRMRQVEDLHQTQGNGNPAGGLNTQQQGPVQQHIRAVPSPRWLLGGSVNANNPAGCKGAVCAWQLEPFDAMPSPKRRAVTVDATVTVAHGLLSGSQPLPQHSMQGAPGPTQPVAVQHGRLAATSHSHDVAGFPGGVLVNAGHAAPMASPHGTPDHAAQIFSLQAVGQHRPQALNVQAVGQHTAPVASLQGVGVQQPTLLDALFDNLDIVTGAGSPVMQQASSVLQVGHACSDAQVNQLQCATDPHPQGLGYATEGQYGFGPFNQMRSSLQDTHAPGDALPMAASARLEAELQQLLMEIDPKNTQQEVDGPSAMQLQARNQLRVLDPTPLTLSLPDLTSMRRRFRTSVLLPAASASGGTSSAMLVSPTQPSTMQMPAADYAGSCSPTQPSRTHMPAAAYLGPFSQDAGYERPAQLQVCSPASLPEPMYPTEPTMHRHAPAASPTTHQAAVSVPSPKVTDATMHSHAHLASAAVSPTAHQAALPVPSPKQPSRLRRSAQDHTLPLTLEAASSAPVQLQATAASVDAVGPTPVQLPAQRVSSLPEPMQLRDSSTRRRAYLRISSMQTGATLVERPSSMPLPSPSHPSLSTHNTTLPSLTLPSCVPHSPTLPSPTSQGFTHPSPSHSNFTLPAPTHPPSRLRMSAPGYAHQSMLQGRTVTTSVDQAAARTEQAATLMGQATAHLDQVSRPWDQASTPMNPATASMNQVLVQGFAQAPTTPNTTRAPIHQATSHMGQALAQGYAHPFTLPNATEDDEARAVELHMHQEQLVPPLTSGMAATAGTGTLPAHHIDADGSTSGSAGGAMQQCLVQQQLLLQQESTRLQQRQQQLQTQQQLLQQAQQRLQQQQQLQAQLQQAQQQQQCMDADRL